MPTMPSDTDVTSYSLVSPEAFKACRSYQLDDSDKLLTLGGRGWLFNEMGTGKTLTAIITLQRLQVKTTLVICPKIVIGVWQAEIAKWWPEAHVVAYTGTPTQRSRHSKVIKDLKWNNPNLPLVVVTNYAQAAEINSGIGNWGCVIFDEAHMLCNRKTKTYQAAESISKNSKHVLELTGTPIRRDGTDIWSYLHLLDPKKYRSYWQFTDENFHIQRGNVFGGFEVIGPKDPPKLQRLVTQYGSRRRKTDVLKELPQKQRQSIPIEMTPAQKKLYDSMADDMMVVEDGHAILAPNGMAALVRLRQLLVSPRILGFEELGAGIAATKYAVGLAIEEGNSVVVFTPFVEAIPILEDALIEIAPTGILHGGLTSNQRSSTLYEMKHLKDPRILITSSGLGMGWSASWASIGIFLGYPFVPIECLQCEDRMHRIGQQKPVSIYYILHKGTADDHCMDILDGKTNWAKLMLDPHLLLGRNKKVTTRN